MRNYFLPMAALLLIAIAASSFRFQSAENPIAVVSADKMNVFYIGVDNPITIAVPGIPASYLRVSLAGGTISAADKESGKYVVRVSGGTESTVQVSYMDEHGALKSAGSNRFRVKRVPDPVCYVGNLKAIGLMSKTELAGQVGVFSRMENFDFDMSFNVVSFILTTYQNGAYTRLKANGPAFTAEMKSLINKAQPKDRFYIEEVIVIGPDGTLRKIPGVTIEIK